MAVRNFSNNAVATELAVSCSDSDVVLSVLSATGWPAAPFTILLEPDEILEEVCLVTGVSGTTLTVVRGYGGTSAVAHTAGAVVRHAAVAQDFTEANQHVNATSGVHGITGPVAGTTATQTLTNKTISGTDNTLSNIPQSAVTGLVSDLAAKAVYPSQTGNSGKVLGTDGTAVSWVAPLAGPTGPSGPTGPAGADGVDGVGVPVGGTTGQVLAKNSNTDYDTEWVNQSGGAVTLSDLTDVAFTTPVDNEVLTYDAGTSQWVNAAPTGGGGGATGGGTDQVFYENDVTVTTNYTITTNKNAVTAGPVTIDSGVTVTVPSGSSWVVV